EYWDLLVADGEISPSAQNPGWPGDDDVWDMFPLDPSEAFDFDGDGIGDNSDPDDDNDGVTDG
ncbi:MAG: hypothetical protein QF377_05300, partial [Candidatus Thalassarchaeum sp.]|nr:hypothetical protein [Candidatus Thalassarchaeum sp.]